MAKDAKEDFPVPAPAVKKTVRKTVKKTVKRKSKNSHAVYILTIMSLLAVIAIMGMNYINQKNVKEVNAKGGSREEKSTMTKDDAAVGKENKEANNKPDADFTEKTELVKVYFIVVDDKTGKARYVPVAKTVKSDNALQRAVEILIKGPDTKEEKDGLITALPDTLKIKNIEIRNGIAVMDFSSEFSYNAIGEITIGRINQLLYTALQFRDVKGIVLKMNGRVMNTIGGDGRVFRWPLTRGL
jgi:spore germination protein GerM